MSRYFLPAFFLAFVFAACARDRDLAEPVREAKAVLEQYAESVGEAEAALLRARDGEAVRSAVDAFQAARNTYLDGVKRLGPAFPDLDSVEGKKLAASFSNATRAQEGFFSNLNEVRRRFGSVAP